MDRKNAKNLDKAAFVFPLLIPVLIMSGLSLSEMLAESGLTGGGAARNSCWYAQCKAHTESQKGMPLDPDILLDCHKILMSGATTTATGEVFESRFRGFDEPVVAGNYIFPNHTDHKKDLEQKLKQLNANYQTSHPVAWASDLMLAVLTLHPFLNGNGRVWLDSVLPMVSCATGSLALLSFLTGIQRLVPTIFAPSRGRTLNTKGLNLSHYPKSRTEQN